MKNKKDLLVRTITGFCLMLILLPAVYFGGIYFLIISILLSIMGTYELMNMFYTKSPRLKYLRFVVPAFSVILTALLFVSTWKPQVFLQKKTELPKSVLLKLKTV